jgi:hypothetical protein
MYVAICFYKCEQGRSVSGRHRLGYIVSVGKFRILEWRIVLKMTKFLGYFLKQKI